MTAPDRKGPAPDKLYADRGPRGGWMFRAEPMPDTLHSYTRDDLATAPLAEALAVPEVATLVEAAQQMLIEYDEVYLAVSGPQSMASAAIALRSALRAIGERVDG